MTKHNLWKSKTRYAKATELQKLTSGYQRRINALQARIQKLWRINLLRKHQISLFSKAVDKSIAEGNLTKEWWKPFLPRKKDVVKEFKL